MSPAPQTRSPAENGGGILGAMTGLGIISFALFPFLLPAIAFASVLLVPLVPLVLAGLLVGAVVAVPLIAARALRRRLRRRPDATLSANRQVLVKD